MLETETKRYAASPTEFKFAADAGADAMTFTGYGAVFGNVDSYGDVIAPGAFGAWLTDVEGKRQPWPAMLAQHGGMGLSSDDMTPVGVWTELSQDSIGLRVKGKLADTPRGRELHTLMKMKPAAIKGLSIGYIPKEWEPRSKPEDPKRRLKRIDVREISPVTFPANRSALVDSVKGSIARPATPRDLEDLLRCAGFSNREAKRAASAAWSALSRGEDNETELHEITAALRKSTAALRI